MSYEVLKMVSGRSTEGVIKYKTTTASEVSFTLTLANRDIDDLISAFATNGLEMDLNDTIGQKLLGIAYYVTGSKMEYLKVEPVASPDTIAFSNLKQMLGVGIDVSLDLINLSPAIGTKEVYSSYFGARIPLASYFEPNKLVGGISKPTPLIKKKSGQDYIDSNNVFSNGYNVRRGWALTCRVSQSWLDGFDNFLRVYQKQELLNFETGGIYIDKFSKSYIMLLHEDNGTSLVYDTIMLFETKINLLEA